MNTRESFSDSAYAEEMHSAERELSAFIGAVTQLFGPEQAKVSAEDWLEESEVMDSPPRSTSRDWRAATVAASAKLAGRINGELHRRISLVTLIDTNVSLIPSSSSFGSTQGRPGKADAQTNKVAPLEQPRHPRSNEAVA